jgi:hypothetical protein
MHHFALCVSHRSLWCVCSTGLTPVAGQMAVGALILATAIYELYVSTQVQKLKLAAKNSFNTVCRAACACFLRALFAVLRSSHTALPFFVSLLRMCAAVDHDLRVGAAGVGVLLHLLPSHPLDAAHRPPPSHWYALALPLPLPSARCSLLGPYFIVPAQHWLVLPRKCCCSVSVCN